MFPVELPNGARVTFTDDEMVPLWGGEARAYRRLTYSHESDGHRPGHTLVFEIVEGQIVCVSATFTGDANLGIAVQQQDMKAVKLDRIGAEAYGWVGIERPNPDGGWIRTIGQTTAQKQRKRIEATPRARDLSRLRKAADAFLNAPDTSNKTRRVEHVATVLVISVRQAWREVEKCEKEGLING